MGHGTDEHTNHTGHSEHGHAAGTDQARHMTHDHHGAGGSHAGHGDHAAHSAHEDHAGHATSGGVDAHAGHHAHHGGRGKVSWKMAAQATLHCLTGCAIGEVLGMIIGTAFGWHNGATMVTAIVLAFVFGYGLTMWGVRKAGLTFKQMVGIALAADTVSIIFMEIVDNLTILVIPGALDAGLGDVLFWGTLAGALALAFLVTTPINKFVIGLGKGHAVVHQYHH